MTIKWIKAKSRAPEHKQEVIILNYKKKITGAIYIDGDKALSVLKHKKSQGAKDIGELPQKMDGGFSSLEKPGDMIAGVTHWMPLHYLPEAKE